MTITMLVFVSTSRSFPGGGRPGSGRRCWRPTAGGVLSLAVMRLRPWKVPTCARTGDPNRMPLPTGCCCGLISIRCSICGLLAPDPVTRTIVVSKLLAGTQYEALSSSQLADPAEARQRPNQEALEIIWQRFREAEDDR